MKKLFTICFISLIGLSLIPSGILLAQPVFPFSGYENNPALTKSPGEWDAGCVFLASPFYFDGTYYLFYTGSEGSPIYYPASIGYATSDDGFNFEKQEDPILEPDGTGFDAVSVSHSIVIEEEGEFRMYYNGTHITPSPGPGKYIGYATATDPGGYWTRLEDPVLSGGNAGEWDAGCVDPNSIIKVDSGYLMFYFGIMSLPINANGSVGMAFSTDGINWEKYDDPATTTPPYAESDPVLIPGVGGSWDDLTTAGCCVIKTFGGSLEMFYAGVNDAAEYGIGYATSTDGVVWVKDYANDPYTYMDDHYAFINGYTAAEFPGVIMNAEGAEYYMYYDYGIVVAEIGMATAENLSAGLPGTAFTDNRTFLRQNHPNPFSNTTTIEFHLVKDEKVSLKIHDLTGREIETLVSGRLEKGEHSVIFHAGKIKSGIYLLTLTAGEQRVTKKLVVQ